MDSFAPDVQTEGIHHVRFSTEYHSKSDFSSCISTGLPVTTHHLHVQMAAHVTEYMHHAPLVYDNVRHYDKCLSVAEFTARSDNWPPSINTNNTFIHIFRLQFSLKILNRDALTYTQIVVLIMGQQEASTHQQGTCMHPSW